MPAHSRCRTILLLFLAVLPLSGCLFRSRKVEQSFSTAPLKSATQQELLDYIYNQASRGGLLPMYDDKAQKWSYATGEGRKLDRAKVEDWKSKFYAFEGFNTTNGWPTRKTLEDIGLKKVADVMQGKNRLG